MVKEKQEGGGHILPPGKIGLRAKLRLKKVLCCQSCNIFYKVVLQVLPMNRSNVLHQCHTKTMSLKRLAFMKSVGRESLFYSKHTR